MFSSPRAVWIAVDIGNHRSIDVNITIITGWYISVNHSSWICSGLTGIENQIEDWSCKWEDVFEQEIFTDLIFLVSWPQALYLVMNM